MGQNERWFPSHLREISKSECLELLASHRVGRVAYCDNLGPVVLPVNYVLDQGTVLIQISPRSTLARHLRSAPASFQIDDVDDFNETGWSVLVRGDAAHVDTPDLPADDEDRPHAWAEGERTFHVRITPHDIRAGGSCPPELTPDGTAASRVPRGCPLGLVAGGRQDHRGSHRAGRRKGCRDAGQGRRSPGGGGPHGGSVPP